MSFIKKKYLKIIFYPIIAIIILITTFVLSFEFFAAPILKSFLQKKVYKTSDSTYLFNFDKLKINIFTGNVIFTGFVLYPDTTSYFKKNIDIEKNLYEIQLDSVLIKKIKLIKLLSKNSSLNIFELKIVKPSIKVFAKNNSKEKTFKENDSISYEVVKKDIISSVFKFTNTIKINKILLVNGVFNFLKPKSDNNNPFTINELTLIVNDFYADKHTFTQNPKNTFSDNFEIIVDDYQLKLNDNLHRLTAKKVYINTKQKTIKLIDIKLFTHSDKRILLKLVTNIFDVKIDSITFKNADFKEIYIDKYLHLSNAEIHNFSINIFQQKKSEKKKISKDSILDKIDIYPLFKKFLTEISIDTLKILNGSFDKYNNIINISPSTTIAKFDIEIYNLQIDSTSVNDSNRILYAENLLLKLYGFKNKMKDSVHILSADYLVASTKDMGLHANFIQLKPDIKKINDFNLKRKNYNSFIISSLNFSGFDFFEYTNNNKIKVQKLFVGDAEIEMTNFIDTLKVKNKKPIDELFKSFADYIYINNIEFKNGNLKYFTNKNNVQTTIEGKFKLFVSNLNFNPYKGKITKLITVGGIETVFYDFNYCTTDSIYTLTVDSLSYSSKKAILKLTNFKFAPHSHFVFDKIKKNKKHTIFKLIVPTLTIFNTNLSSAFQSDSLSLNRILLENPQIEIINFQNKNARNQKEISDGIKRKTIANIIKTATKTEVTVYSNLVKIDSLTLTNLQNKKNAIDTISKIAVKNILKLTVTPSEVNMVDTTIVKLKKIETITINKITSLAHDSLTDFQIDTIIASTISQIKYLSNFYNRTKINKKDILKTISNFIPQIYTDSLEIRNGNFKMKSSINKTEKTVISSNFSLYLNGFNFTTDSSKISKKIFFSDEFRVVINKIQYTLSDSIHKIFIANIYIKSKDSSIFINNFALFPRYSFEKGSTIKLQSDTILISGIDFNKLFFDKYLLLKKILIKSPKINISTKKNKNKTKKAPLTHIFLPHFIKKLLIQNIEIKNCNFNLKSFDSKNIKVESKIDLNIYDFAIDSMTVISKNLYFLPIKNFELNLKNSKYISKDSVQIATIKNTYINSKNSIIDIDSFDINKNFDTTLFSQTEKPNNIINFNFSKLLINNISKEKLRFSNILEIDNFKIENVNVEVFNKAKKQKTSINEIDLYKLIKDIFKKITFKKFFFDNINIKINTLKDTIFKTQIFRNVNVKISNLNIDSSTTYTKPNLFYCEDISFSLNNLQQKTKDSLFIMSLKNIKGSTKNKELSIKNFRLLPIGELSKIQENYKWRMSPVQIEINEILINNLNYEKILKKELIANYILCDSLILKAFTDRNYLPDPKLIKPHLIEKILNLPILLDINTIKIIRCNIFYEEINPDNQQKATVSLNRMNFDIIRLTNDTAKINQENIFTLIKLNGFINDSAEVTLTAFIDLKSRGNYMKITGSFGKCNASVFNSYTINGANLALNKGIIEKIVFEFDVDDTMALGKLKMEYKDLDAYFISKDTTKREKLKFLSWLAKTLIIRNDNPRYGVIPKIGNIAYIHDKHFSDIKLILKALLSGIQSTIAFDTKDVKKIRKIIKEKERKEKKNIKNLGKIES